MNGKHIILGVTGGIAVYKAADLCSKLVSEGFDVRVVMTPNALRLISSQIFLTLSKNRVLTDLFDEYQPRPEHVDWAEWADLLVVAPATANFIGKFASGIADDALSTTALTFRGPVLLAPAMNENMWNSPVVQDNLAKLTQKLGVRTVGPDTGRLACGTSGKGRMAEPADILEAIRAISA